MASVRFRMVETSQATLELVDMNGRVVKQLADGEFGEGVHQLAFDASSYQPGVYIVRLSANIGSIMSRVVINN